MLKHLIEFEFTATHRFANEDIYINNVLYQGKLLGEVSISAMLPDSFYGVKEPQSITIKFANIDGYFTTLGNAEELRGKVAYIRRNEDGTNIESLRGTVTGHDIADEASFTILLENPDPLQVDIPKQTLKTDLWSNVPEKDLGKPFAIPIGYCERVPCIYAGEVAATSYDYIIGHGPIESLTKLYRAGVEISGAQYTFYDGSQGSPYAGYAFVRFTTEQRDFSNSLFEITADVRGLEMGGSVAQRNFVRVIQNLLSTSPWGLGLSVNTTSFDTAASVVIDNTAGTMADLLCDGDINRQEKAQDILDKLLFACRGSLSVNLSGQYEISIDTYKSTSSATFGSGDGYYDNISSIKSRKKTSTSEALKTFTLNYRKNNDKGEFKQKISRSIFSFGVEQIIDSPFVRDSTTADRIVCYRQKRALNADERLEIEVGKEGNALKAGDRITLSIPRMGITSAAYQVEVVQKALTTFSLTLRSYAQAIYDYSAGTLPTDEMVEVKAAPTQNKITSSAAASPPADPGVSDLWYQTDTYLTKKWSGTAWDLIEFNASTIKAGSITSQVITLAVTEAAGDVAIKAGKTDFGDTTAGFILGIDDSDSNKVKFEIGDDTEYLNWTMGVGLTVAGDIIIKNPATVRSDINVANGATANSTDATLLARSNHTGTQGATSLDTTVISGGKIITMLLTADNIQTGTLTGRTIQTAASGKRFVVDTATNEAHFYGDRGDGTVEELAFIGIGNSGYGLTIGHFGSTTCSRIGVTAMSSSSYAVYGISLTGTAIKGAGVVGLHGTGTNAGVVGDSTLDINYGAAVKGDNNGTGSGYFVGVYGYSDDSNLAGTRIGVFGNGDRGAASYGGYFTSRAVSVGGAGAPIILAPHASASAPTHNALKGSLWVTSGGVLYINTSDSTTWAKVGAQ